MSVYYYDQSITDYLSKAFGSQVYVTPADTIIRNLSDLNEDKIRLPLLNLERSGVVVRSTRNSYMNHTGLGFKSDNTIIDTNEDPDYRLQAVPITINYIIDIWTRDRLTNDNIFRELLMYLIDQPELLVKIPYGVGSSHKFNIFVEESITDNSDIVNHPNYGVLFRTSIPLYTDDAYLFRTPSSPSYSINGIHVIDKKYNFEY